MELLTGVGLTIPAGLNAHIQLPAVGLSIRFGLIEVASPYDLLGEWWAASREA